MTDVATTATIPPSSARCMNAGSNASVNQSISPSAPAIRWALVRTMSMYVSPPDPGSPSDSEKSTTTSTSADLVGQGLGQVDRRRGVGEDRRDARLVDHHRQRGQLGGAGRVTGAAAGDHGADDLEAVPVGEVPEDLVVRDEHAVVVGDRREDRLDLGVEGLELGDVGLGAGPDLLGVQRRHLGGRGVEDPTGGDGHPGRIGEEVGVDALPVAEGERCRPSAMASWTTAPSASAPSMTSPQALLETGAVDHQEVGLPHRLGVAGPRPGSRGARSPAASPR